MSIEEKIAKILAEGNAKDNLAEEQAKPPAYTQNPDNARNNVDRQTIATGGTSKKANRATQGASAPEANHLTGSSTMKEGIDALVNGENLSEEFKAKAATIFEAAVLGRVAEEIEALDEQYAQIFEERLQEAVEEKIQDLTEQLDGYLNYIVEQWMEENKLAVERGVKLEVMENFMLGVKSLFQENYISIPETELDMVDELAQRVEELQEELDQEVRNNIELNAALMENVRLDIVSEYTDGLAQTEVDRFVTLTEEIAFESAEIFSEKVATIRENFFNKKPSRLTESMYRPTYDEPSTGTLNESDSFMGAYVDALDRSNKQ
jgi:hypothetical protein